MKRHILLPALLLPLAAAAFAARGAPPEIVTEALPDGVPGEPYEAVLEATGGTPPYAWSAEDAVRLDFAGASTFAETGTAQGWRKDDGYWRVDLPFEFPFFGTNYTFAWVDSNGRITFGDHGHSYHDCDPWSFWEQRVIAVMWDDLRTTGDGCDIFVSSNDVSVAIRWAAEYNWTNGVVNASATLYPDGRVVLAFGPGNEHGGAVGYSAGDYDTNATARDPEGGWGNAPDVTFKAPRMPVMYPLPPGISVSPDGTVSGTCTEPGWYRVDFTVTDAAGERATTAIELDFPPDPIEIVTETLPSGEEWRPYSAKLEATGGVEPYRWEEMEIQPPWFSSSSSFEETGTAQGWRSDDEEWWLQLPFPFPYFGRFYTNAWVTSCGEIVLGDPEDRHYSFEMGDHLERPTIWALYGGHGTAGDGCDIFVSTNWDCAMIRWTARRDSWDGDDLPANFSATLYRNGEIVLAYGDVGEEWANVCFTAGDGRTSYYVEQPENGWSNAPDVKFQAPVPQGIEIDWDGTVSGTPLINEDFEFYAYVTDTVGQFDQKRVSLPVSHGPLAIVTDPALPDGVTGKDYFGGEIRIAGGTRPYRSSVDGLPGFLFASSGEDSGSVWIEGFPEAGCGGTYPFTIRATDSAGATVEKSFTVRIVENANRPPAIVSVSPGTNDLVRIAEGGAADFTVSATDPDGDELTYTWSVYADWGDSDIPDSTGGGTYRLAPKSNDPNLLYARCRVEDGAWHRDVKWTVFVGELRDLAITNDAALPDLVEGEEMSPVRMKIDGGAGRVECSLVSSTLPGGEIFVDEFFNELSVGCASHPGDWEITVGAEDRFGRTARKTFTLHIEPGARTAASPVPVPHWWIDYFAEDALEESGGDYEAAAVSEARNGNGKVWECFLAGLHPEFSNNSSWCDRQFRADIRLDGETPVVEWDPDLGSARTYTIEGNADLSPEGWHSPTNANDRFFRVQVSLPQ